MTSIVGDGNVRKTKRILTKQVGTCVTRRWKFSQTISRWLRQERQTYAPAKKRSTTSITMFALSTVSARRLLRHCRPVITNIFVRNLNVHEYISMGLLKDNGIHVPECHVANAPDEAAHIFRNILNKRKCDAVRQRSIFRHFLDYMSQSTLLH